MKIQQKLLLNSNWKTIQNQEGFVAKAAQFVLVFGGKYQINKTNICKIKEEYSNALIVSTTTSGEILDNKLYENQLTCTAIQFEKTQIEYEIANIKEILSSYELGVKLMEKLNQENLIYVLVLSDGNLINGSELVEGIHSKNKNQVLVTGGLAGDSDRFESTIVGIGENLREGNVVLIGFYGNSIKVGHGSLGGWDEFGHERKITKSDKNILFELDGKSALNLYKEYLGDYANELPSSALLFPLSLKIDGTDNSKNVRTILSIDEKTNSMTFAGNMPEGGTVRLMKANFDKLIEASSGAANASISAFTSKPQLALVISCIGRKLILNERVEEELENVKEVFGTQTAITGFYSYGEISSHTFQNKCELQNQTMTITTFSEI